MVRTGLEASNIGSQGKRLNHWAVLPPICPQLNLQYKINGHKINILTFLFVSCFIEQAKSVLLENKGAEKIVKKLGVLEKSFDEESDNRVELAACGSMLNVASDDGKVIYLNLPVNGSVGVDSSLYG